MLWIILIMAKTANEDIPKNIHKYVTWVAERSQQNMA